jgi:hypothetical protein
MANIMDIWGWARQGVKVCESFHKSHIFESLYNKKWPFNFQIEIRRGGSSL